MRANAWRHIKRSFYIGISGFGLTCVMFAGSVACGQEGIWHIGVSDDGTVIATAGMDQTGSVGKILTALNVGFNAKRQCQAELGFAILKGGTYGEALGKQSPPRTEPIMLMVDGVQVATPAPTLVKYDNGFEAVFPADTTIVQALAAGITAKVRMLVGTPVFELPISGAAAAIAQAQRRCAGMR